MMHSMTVLHNKQVPTQNQHNTIQHGENFGKYCMENIAISSILSHPNNIQTSLEAPTYLYWGCLEAVQHTDIRVRAC